MSHNFPSPPAMDYIKSLKTGVNLIAGFQCVHFWVYSINRDQGAVDDRSIEDVRLFAESALRERKALLHVQEDKESFWLFSGAAGGNFAQKPDLETVGIESMGWKWTLTGAGTLKASELSVLPVRSQAPAIAVGTADLSSATGPTATASAQSPNMGAVYSRFVKALQDCFAYTLAKEHDTFRLGDSLFVTGHGFYDGGAEEDHLKTTFSLDFSLANGGGLLISATVSKSFSVHSLKGLRPRTRIRIAPAGHAAVLFDSDNMGSLEATTRWKQLVSKHLQTQGIHVTETEDWVLLTSVTSVQDGNSERVYFWPKRLCFTRDTGADSPVPSSFDLTRPWLRPSEGGEYQDVFHVTQGWFDAKTHRDKLIEDRAKKKHEREMARIQAQTMTFAATSPPYPRDALLGLSGVYPTPPDGVAGNLHLGASSGDGTVVAAGIEQGGRPNSVDMLLSDSMEAEAAPSEMDPRQRPGTISGGSPDDSMSNRNVIFEVEDDEMKGQDITDADFSFFDDDDIVMAEAAPSKNDNQIDSHIKSDPELETVDNFHETSSYPSDSGPGAGDDENKGTGDGASARVDKVSQSIEMAHSEASTAVYRPLDPASLQRRLFDIPEADSTKHQQSLFGPIHFNMLLSCQDATYKDRTRTSGGLTQVSLVSNSQGTLTGIHKPNYGVPHQSSVSTATAKHALPDDSGDSTDGDGSRDGDDRSDDPESFVVEPSSERDGTFDFAMAQGKTEPDILEPALPCGRHEEIALLKPLLRMQQALSDTMSPTNNVVIDNGPLTPTTPATASPRRLHHLEGPLNPMHKGFIAVAQLVAEQISLGFVNEARSKQIASPLKISSELVGSGNRGGISSVVTALRSCSEVLTSCDLLHWLCVEEAALEKQLQTKSRPSAPPKRVMLPHITTSDGKPVPAITVSSLGTPHLRVRRGESLWDVLPPALPFWEQLGLGPSFGRKNLMAFCVYPDNDDLKGQLRTFLNQLGATFESCRLGTHVCAASVGGIKDGVGGIEDGMVPVKFDDQRRDISTLNPTLEICARLGRVLAGIDWTKKIMFSPPVEELTQIDCFVIYMVDTADGESRNMLQLCAAFWTLYETYRTSIVSARLSKSPPDVVLQVLPLRYAADLERPVVMDSAFFQKLAREVYDRCPPSVPEIDSSRLPLPSAPSIMLEAPIPKKIDFKLQNDPPSDILQEGSHLHIAYARYRDWMCVAWTDSTGRSQGTSAYCLVSRSFFEVAKVVWQSTVEILRARKISWRVCLCKVGSIEQEEMDAWSSLATGAYAVQIITVIMSLDPRPPVQIWKEESLSTAGPKSGASQQATHTPVTTPGPASTPGAGISPENVLTPASTPAPEPAADYANDPDAHLVDIGDDTLGLILGHRTNVAPSLDAYRPSLSSGFLLKGNAVSGTALDDEEEDLGSGPILIGVCLVWIGSSPKPGAQTAPVTPYAQPSHPQRPSSSTDQAATLAQQPALTTSHNTSGGTSILGVGTSAGSIPKMTADSILKDYLAMYRHLGVLARVRGLRGTRRGTLPWHVVVAMNGLNGLRAQFGDLRS